MADPGRAFFVSGVRGEVTGPADCGLKYPLGVCVLRKKFFLVLYFVVALEATTTYSMICWKMPCVYHEIMIQCQCRKTLERVLGRIAGQKTTASEPCKLHRKRLAERWEKTLPERLQK